ncbi:DUF4200 domain-containing protein [Candidatus Entotheonella palauensis]|uniref:Porin n=1 Tax=Candidatus Entotheonella gemina TaxID=1429439 RepID=W4MGH6_9BACT|nr:DUF4200 domain-containing protein [Candidatus Entotheonella palauensis]ETX09293.1 MAG: hypothetical protein ETSY2_00325 [Candidatus Entotheonella gemina]
MDRQGPAAMIILILAICLIASNGAWAQTASPSPQGVEKMEQELQQMRESIRTMRETVRSQQELLRQQEERLRQQEQNLEQLRRESASAPPPPPPAAAAPAPAPRLPGGLLLNPEMRVEGNMIGNKTYGLERDAELQGFSSDRFSLKTVEVGFRASVDPFAEFEAVIEAQRLVEVELDGGRQLENALELEVAHLTLPRLPLRTRGRIGLMRTSFGEYNDDDPEEFPQIDPPNVIVNIFGEEGEGWKDVGFNLNYQFGNPWSDKLTHLLWFGIYAGENNTAFNGGNLDKPVYFARAETFFELGTRAGAELGISFAAGQRPAGDVAGDDDDDDDNGNGGMVDDDDDDDDDNGDDDNGDDEGMAVSGGSLDTFLFNVHFEIDWQPSVYSLDRGFSLLSEFFYAHAEREDDDIDSFGGYVLTQYRLNSRWAIGGRFDASECPGFANSLCVQIDSDKPIEERFEWAISPILSYSPSRFLTFRLQYKHTDRNYADDSDELMAQALFIIGYERPEPF